MSLTRPSPDDHTDCQSWLQEQCDTTTFDFAVLTEPPTIEYVGFPTQEVECPHSGLFWLQPSAREAAHLRLIGLPR